jgi:hypothetical protein
MARKKTKAGRPPRHAGEHLRKNRTFRVRDQLDEMLEASAKKAGRSVSEEIEHRLELGFWEDRVAAARTGSDVGAELLRMFYSVMVFEGVHPDWTGDPVRAENFRVAMNAIIAVMTGLPLELPAPEKRLEGIETAKQYLLRSSRRGAIPEEIISSNWDPTADWGKASAEDR